MCQLDEASVKWLGSIGLLKQLGIVEAKSICDLESHLRTGVLLCLLVETLFKVKLIGVFRNPKTEATCLQNIRKALDVLRKMKKMDQTFTWCDK